MGNGVARLSTVGLIAAVCAAEVLTMLGFSTFAALLPSFKQGWQLSNTDAGWISAIFFAGYTLAVPILVSLTDRVDPKRIYLLSAVLAGTAGLGFAVFAEGFWSALLFRGLAGIGLAGTYMPGLKALSDHIGAEYQSRAVAFYTSSFGIGAALSFPLASLLAEGPGWRWAFAGPGAAAVLAGVLVLLLVPRSAPHHLHAPDTALLDFRPVLRNRSALAYTLCYTVHNWELFGFRSWIVAFLVFAGASGGASGGDSGGGPALLLDPTMIAAAVIILGMPASILGNELSMRFGRRRTVALIMTASALLCFTIGFTAALPYLVVVLFCVLQGFTVSGESASVTAGALGSAAPGYRGATMAMHSTLGFTGSFFGPLVFGFVLDLAGGESVLAWGLAFAHMGLVMLAGPLALALLRPKPLPGDRAPATAPGCDA
jgi:MFS family permease